MRKPILESGSLTWAPSGAAFIDDSVFFAGLRGSALFEAELDNQRRLKKHLEGQFGRLRDVVLGTDGLYIATNNRDGRGEPREGDDKIIKINLQGT
jgi:glucose/arabinose dehydrogenase